MPCVVRLPARSPVALSASIHTLRHHVQQIHDKAGVRSRAQLMETLHLRRERIAAS